MSVLAKATFFSYKVNLVGCLRGCSLREIQWEAPDSVGMCHLNIPALCGAPALFGLVLLTI